MIMRTASPDRSRDVYELPQKPRILRSVQLFCFYVTYLSYPLFRLPALTISKPQINIIGTVTNSVHPINPNPRTISTVSINNTPVCPIT